MKTFDEFLSERKDAEIPTETFQMKVRGLRVTAEPAIENGDVVSITFTWKDVLGKNQEFVVDIPSNKRNMNFVETAITNEIEYHIYQRKMR